MNHKIFSLFLPILQLITGCLAFVAFFVLISNHHPIRSILLALVTTILAIKLGLQGLFEYKNKSKDNK